MWVGIAGTVNAVGAQVEGRRISSAVVRPKGASTSASAGAERTRRSEHRTRPRARQSSLFAKAEVDEHTSFVAYNGRGGGAGVMTYP